MTLTHYLTQHQDINPEVASILLDLSVACKDIAHDVARSGLLDLHGHAGSENIQGEEVQKLDEHTNELLKRVLGENGHVRVVASEEEDTVVDCNHGSYGVAFDPLDGSSNIDINGSVGTIFSIVPAESADESVFLCKASEQAASGYVMYGSSTVMMFTTGDGVTEFTLDPDAGEFVQTIVDVKIPEDSGYIAFNPYVLYTMPEEKAAKYQKLCDETKKSMRYVGAMVADVHRTLLKGGFFAYPENKDGKAKLRLQYEAKPLGWLVEQAGGKCLLDNVPIDDCEATELHQRVSVELGDPATMSRYLSA